MKNLIFILGLLIFSGSLQAQELSVQRALNSNYQDYVQYLRQQQKQSFAESYLTLNEKIEVKSANVEDCLMDLLQEINGSNSCDKAIYELTRRPLNPMSAEVLASLLNRLIKSNIQEKQFFNSLLNSLLTLQPVIKNSLQISKRLNTLPVNAISKLEYQAWSKMLFKKADSREVVLLLNGKKVPSLVSFHPGQGVFQWSLITNTFTPFNFVGTWQQFSLRSLKAMTPFFQGSCDDLRKQEIPTAEMLNVEVFLDAKCIKTSENVFQNKYQPDPSKDLLNRTNSQSVQENKWVVPSVFVAAGVALIANSLKNKKVRVTMPGFN